MEPRTELFEFTGTGGEFFRIWIVNILLSIVTLGIYSAWAKVRTNRYLYGNTRVAGGHFDYHASPMVILRGRIIAIALLLIYSLFTQFFPLLGLLALLAILIALPFIVVRALTFNARMSSWRNIRFNFVGDVGGAWGAYFGWPSLGVLTAGLFVPFAWFKKAEYGVNNHRLGSTPFELGAKPVDFYVMALVLLGMGLAVIAVFAMLGVGLGQLVSASEGNDQAMVLVLVVVGIGYLALFSLFGALRFRLVYNDLGLGENSIHNSMSVPGYLTVAVTNTLLMVVTLGLFYPWAKVRMTRFLVESLRLEAVNVDEFVAVAVEEQKAFGEEFGEAFDLGIGV